MDAESKEKLFENVLKCMLKTCGFRITQQQLQEILLFIKSVSPCFTAKGSLSLED